MTLHVDHAALERISRGLSDAGTNLDSKAASAPAAVDGGLGTPAILGIISRLVENAGQLVVGVKAAGDAVASASTNYRNFDESSADSQNQAVWKE